MFYILLGILAATTGLYILGIILAAKADQDRRNQKALFCDRQQDLENASFWKGTPFSIENEMKERT